MEIFKKMGYNFVDLDRDQAKETLERFGKSEGITVSLSQLIESLTLAFFLHENSTRKPTVLTVG